MKALSIMQPWATLIVIGAKRFETRSWYTHFRGELAIHASKKFTDADRLMCMQDPFKHTLLPLFDNDEQLMRASILKNEGRPLPLGAVIGTTVLTKCMPACVVAGQINERERAFGWYDYDRFAWQLEDATETKQPYPVRGAQGLWELPADIAASVESEFSACVR